MNKDEFLRQLEVLLSGISQEERTEALAFYRSYFEDAGEANEAKILEELESPQKVADSIIKDLGVQPGEACSSGAQGASAGAEWNPAVQSAPEGATTGAEWNPAVRGAAQNASKGVPQGAAQNAAYSAPEKDGMPGWAIVLLVITSPVWLVMILVILSALLGIVAALFGIAIAVVAVMGALLICGVVLFGAGIGTAIARKSCNWNRTYGSGTHCAGNRYSCGGARGLDFRRISSLGIERNLEALQKAI